MIRFLKWIVYLAIAALLFELGTRWVAEVLWFQDVGYLSSFLARSLLQVGLWVLVFVSSVAFFESTRRHAEYWGHPKPNGNPYPETVGALSLPWLLLAIAAISLALGLMLFDYGEVVAAIARLPGEFPWTLEPAEIAPPIESGFLPDMALSLPPPFELSFLQFRQESRWLLVVLPIVVLCLVTFPQQGVKAIAIALSACFATATAASWTKILLFFNSGQFDIADPVFNKDVGFYIFRLPLLELSEFWWGGVTVAALLATTLVYLLSGDSLSQGKFPGFSLAQVRHLSWLGSATFLTFSFRHGLARFELLYSERGVTYGASYTDNAVQMPLETGTSVLTAAIAIWLFWKAITLRDLARTRKAGFWRVSTSPIPVLWVYAIALSASAVLPVFVQRFDVQPNELSREQTYIERSIAFTRQGFALDEIDVQPFNPRAELSREDLDNNEQTIRNMRLWDSRPLLQANRQLQQIRSYYKFPDADIDRYTLLAESGDRDTRRQQVAISARELQYEDVPQQAKTWVNKHLIYTHGYGFTLSPVNQVDEGGLPKYFVKDIGTDGRSNAGSLRTSDPIIRNSIPIGRPRIYYGQITDTYVMTNTKEREFDFPSGEENVYTVYDGRSGIAIGPLWRRLLFAYYLRDWQMLFTRDFTPTTQLLMRRTVAERIRAIAPFLRFDRDPYLVTADTGDPTQNYLYWIVDAYTTSDRYPYSDPGENEFNYLRNSVKVVVDAYNGDVDFYLADARDPVVKSWARSFPNFFKPFAELPATLSSHIRYPVDRFLIQSERLLSYHMTDPQVFYNREDQWQIPDEIYGDRVQSVSPYYMTVKLPQESSAEFILFLPFTPTERPNLIAWLVARSDGTHYGEQILYRLPKQKPIYGPEQIEALVGRDPAISQRLSLWSQQESRVVKGNLIVLPIEESLMYIEPVYLEAERNSLPTLASVIIIYDNQIVMAPTFEAALDIIFPEGDRAEIEEQSIQRSLEELIPSLPLESFIPNLELTPAE